MGLLNYPEKLEDWNVEKLNELIKLKDVESERFDFKKDLNELFVHICAMANTSGGFIVLGIGEVKGKDGRTIIRFQKRGFKDGNQDSVLLQIRNSIVNVEPTPIVNAKPITEDGKFYTVLKIENEISKKPFFIKDRGQCYVRIANSSTPASRSTVLSLFSHSVERRNNVERLRTASMLLKEAFRFALSDCHIVSPSSTMKIAPIDLTFMKNAVLSCEWLLREKNLLGEHTGQSSYTTGINSVLHEMESFNAYINGYNGATTESERDNLKRQLSSWSLGSSYEQKTIEFLDLIKKTAEEFLSKN